MENEKEMEVFTLVDDEGNEYIVADYVEVDEKKYAILVAAECECGEGEECEEEEAYIFRVEVSESGEEELVDIEDDEEYEKVIAALDELEDYEDVEEDEDEE